MSARIISTKTAAETALAAAFGAVKASLPGSTAVAKQREASFDAFAEAGLPHRRIEAWHYTDLRSLMREALPLAAVPDAAALAPLRKSLAAARLPSQKLILVDGIFAPDLSDPMPASVTVRALSTVLAEGRSDLMELVAAKGLGAEDPIVALNAAMMQDGVVIEIAPGAEIAAPIHIVHATATTQPAARFSRSLVVVGAGASVRIAESSFGDGARTGQTFGCLIFAVGDDARVGHSASLTKTVPASLRVESFMVDIGARANFDSFALVAGGGTVRRQIFMRFSGQGAVGALRGVSLLRGRDHADTSLFVEHVAAGCEGRETFRYILDEESTGVFQGRIRVAPNAQKTDGKMLSKALLLSDKAAMNNKPELEIFADDVVCGHGATCGGLSQDQLFYLQSRGIPHPVAEALLLEAFASELADDIGHAELTDAFREEVTGWLAARART